MVLRTHARTRVRSARRERGGAMVELALLLPLLMVAMLGMVDFGRAAFEAMEVENAAEAGASYGARSKALAADALGIKNAALADMGSEVNTSKVKIDSERYCECPSGSSVNCDLDCAGILPLMYVRVSVDKPFDTLLKYPGISNHIDLHREAHVRVR